MNSINRKKLRSIIFSEMKKMLQDDALFRSRDDDGVLTHFDIPGDVVYDTESRDDSCSACGFQHSDSCEYEDEHEDKSDLDRDLYYITQRYNK